MKAGRGAWIALAALVALPLAAQAQTGTVSGSIGNFDVINNVGEDAHGFEIELEGLQPNDVFYTFQMQRYGAPSIQQTPTGVTVRWESPYVGGSFTQTTIPHKANTPFAGSCYSWGASYDQSGCEHFGVSLSANPAAQTYRWLVADPQNAGALTAFDPATPVAAPVYVIQPPAIANNPPVLVVEVEASEPAETPELYGDAQWMKVFKTDLPREVGLDELVTDNPLVPQDAAHLETEWTLVQAEPASGADGGNRRRKRNQGGLDAATRSVVRRYELYAFTGVYDPATHEALCADLTCTAPAAGEVGDFISAQMTAANVVVPSVRVGIVGSGSVSSFDRAIACGNKCTQYVSAGQTVTLTASSSSGSVFTGWSGACSGNATTCSVVVSDNAVVGATFAATYTLSVSRSNKGAITSDDGGISCGTGGGGGACSTKYAAATLVTLRAVPPAGAQFLGWGGACSGTTMTCEVAIVKGTSVQANFSK
jgi:hypothetical protein